LKNKTLKILLRKDITFMDNYVLALLKFGKTKHIRELQNGILYMNPLSYFRGIEEDKSRGDKNEGLHRFLQKDSLTITIGDQIINKEDIVKPVEIRLSKVQDFNLFCMYAINSKTIKSNNFQFILDDRIYKFGDACLAVQDGDEFINRIKLAINNKNKVLNKRIKTKGSKLVEYVDKKNYSGEMGIFKKFNNYSYQHEYRIAFDVPEDLRNETGVFKLDIGDISDITKIFKTSEFENIMEIRIE
jgi:hypothetical protein